MVDTTNREKIDKIQDAPAASVGASYTKQNDIKSQRIDVISTADDSVNLTEPSSKAHAEYLYNKAEYSQSGHLRELDDTPGAERIMEMHKSGTFYEIHPDGTKVTRIYGDNFEIALSDNNMIVGGDLNITVQGNANILTKGNTKHKIGGDYDLVVHGDMSTRVEGTRIDYTKGDHDIQTASDLKIRSEGITDIFAKTSINTQTDGTMTLDCGSSFVQYCGGSYTVTIASSFNIKSGAAANIDAVGVVYIDGSEVRWNNPGPGVSAINPSTNDPLDKDPTGGLTVEDSVIDPSVESLQITKTANVALSGIVDSTVTSPKDRTNI